MSSERRFLIPSRVFRNFNTKPANNNYKLIIRIAHYRLKKVYLAYKCLYDTVNQRINKLFNSLIQSVSFHFVSFTLRSFIFNVVFPAFKKNMSWIKELFSKGIKKDTVSLGLTFQSPYPAFIDGRIFAENAGICMQAIFGRDRALPAKEKPDFKHHLTNYMGLKMIAQTTSLVQASINNYASNKYQ